MITTSRTLLFQPILYTLGTLLLFQFLATPCKGAISEPTEGPGRGIASRDSRGDIVVAVIDTGVDTRHPALKNHLWINPGEIPNNGIDDDGNGFVDDVYGWDFVEQKPLQRDPHGHGTHIAGIIAGAKSARIMALRAFDENKTGEEVLQASVRAIHYAIRMKAKIINYSGGGSVPSPEEKRALQLATDSGILVIAAAGNGRHDSDERGFYPASYNLPNLLSIAAVDGQGRLLSSSNFGNKTVHLAAVGEEILSCLPDNQFGSMSGTSQATAEVTKVAVNILRQTKFFHHQKRSPASTIIHILLKSADAVPELKGKLRTPAVVNPVRAANWSGED